MCSNFDLIFENDKSVGYVSEHNADLQKRLNSDIGVDVEEAAPGTKVSNWEKYVEVKQLWMSQSHLLSAALRKTLHEGRPA